MTESTLNPTIPGPSRQALADIAGRSLLLTLMFCVGHGAWQRMAALLPLASPAQALTFLAQFGSVLFAGLVCLLAIIRLPSQRRAGGWVALVSAFGGAFGLTIVNQMPPTSLPLVWSVASAALLAVGNATSVYCLARLGRSFSVLPEARRLVTTGPYAVVRHPLYLAEGVATLGVVILHWSLLAVAVGVLQTVLQGIRLRQEENVLRESFPDYADYAAITPCVIPFWRPSAR